MDVDCRSGWQQCVWRECMALGAVTVPGIIEPLSRPADVPDTFLHTLRPEPADCAYAGKVPAAPGQRFLHVGFPCRLTVFGVNWPLVSLRKASHGALMEHVLGDWAVGMESPDQRSGLSHHHSLLLS